MCTIQLYWKIKWGKLLKWFVSCNVYHKKKLLSWVLLLLMLPKFNFSFPWSVYNAWHTSLKYFVFSPYPPNYFPQLLLFLRPYISNFLKLESVLTSSVLLEIKEEKRKLAKMELLVLWPMSANQDITSHLTAVSACLRNLTFNQSIQIYVISIKEVICLIDSHPTSTSQKRKTTLAEILHSVRNFFFLPLSAY